MNIVTYHNDAARTGTEFGTSSWGWWRKAYDIALTAHPPGSDGAAVRGAPLWLSQWHFNRGTHSGLTADVIIVASSDNNVYAFQDLRPGPATNLWTASLDAALNRPGSNIPPPVGI